MLPAAAVTAGCTFVPTTLGSIRPFSFASRILLMLIGLATDSSPRPGTRVVPAVRRLAAMVSIPPLVRDLRADLARRPTMTELFHRGYNPRTLPPEFTTWFDFVAAEGDATALEAECLGRFRDWFVMLATTRMTKSFKMVLLRVLLDRVLLKKAAVFSGMPIPEMAAKCREFLVAHEFLRRDIADAATGQPVELSPRKWESSWRKFPISIWMQEQEGRSWFAIAGDLTIVGEFLKLVMRS